jgi:hypothetical protein
MILANDRNRPVAEVPNGPITRISRIRLSDWLRADILIVIERPRWLLMRRIAVRPASDESSRSDRAARAGVAQAWQGVALTRS